VLLEEGSLPRRLLEEGSLPRRLLEEGSLPRRLLESPLSCVVDAASGSSQPLLPSPATGWLDSVKRILNEYAAPAIATITTLPLSRTRPPLTKVEVLISHCVSAHR